jgi:hypothetical protein
MKLDVKTYFILTTVLMLVAIASGCARRSEAPIGVVTSLEEAFNAKDLDATTAPFHRRCIRSATWCWYLHWQEANIRMDGRVHAFF